MGFYRLLRRLGVPMSIAAFCGGGLLILYGMLTGFGVSVFRAVGMYLIRMFSVLVGRTYDMLTALGVTGVILVLQNPAWLENMGYLLSFGSVAGLGVLLPGMTRNRAVKENGPQKYTREESRLGKFVCRGLKKMGMGLKEGLTAGVAITLTTLPIQLWFSYEISLYAIFLNAVILPFMGAVMISGLAAMLVPGLGIAGTADVLILSAYEVLCHICEALPGAIWNPGRPSPGQMVLYYVVWSVAVFIGYGKKGSRRKGIIQKIILSIGIMVLILPGFRGDRITFLDT